MRGQGRHSFIGHAAQTVAWQIDTSSSFAPLAGDAVWRSGGGAPWSGSTPLLPPRVRARRCAP